MNSKVTLYQKIPEEWRQKWIREYDLPLQDDARIIDVLRIVYNADTKGRKRNARD